MMRVLVTGAGGFIGHHLVRRLKADGHWVRGVDVKKPQWSESDADEFKLLDLRHAHNASIAVAEMEWVFALAADMGGAGFIFTGDNDRDIMFNNVRINVNTLESAVGHGVKRYLYTSSACVYPEYLQLKADVLALREQDAYPAEPDSAYGWEKLFTEQLCAQTAAHTDIRMHVARFHNIMGAEGEWEGGREKAPAAMMRKAAEAKLSGSGKIEVWGDGLQTRSFCYIDDCVEMIMRLMATNYAEPLNIGTEEMVTINRLAELAAEAAGLTDYELVHIPGPQGVRGRNADLTKMREVLGYEPQYPLRDAVALTYPWIEGQVMKAHVER